MPVGGLVTGHSMGYQTQESQLQTQKQSVSSSEVMGQRSVSEANDDTATSSLRETFKRACSTIKSKLESMCQSISEGFSNKVSKPIQLMMSGKDITSERISNDFKQELKQDCLQKFRADMDTAISNLNSDTNSSQVLQQFAKDNQQTGVIETLTAYGQLFPEGMDFKQGSQGNLVTQRENRQQGMTTDTTQLQQFYQEHVAGDSGSYQRSAQLLLQQIETLDMVISSTQSDEQRDAALYDKQQIVNELSDVYEAVATEQYYQLATLVDKFVQQ
ncbi:hypothetical protein [Motilimonas pumila]|uniref:Uncharacterized protein n=1 Tax=Motilimonas pumila TaxID=2303987 RepID=A0A418YE70_9GAMM|nr:hypothetical protein [Motilimonas pumila]RJG42774.1 hypothetical protein D1Z90_11840 [Motilimonas pumila]